MKFSVKYYNLFKNNDSFIMPTIMIYIFLFLSILCFLIVQIVGYNYAAKNFQQNNYYESAKLDIEKQISNYLKNSKNYKKICQRREISRSSENYNYSIEKTCLEFKGNIEEYFQNKKLELTEEEYNKIWKEILQANENDKLKKEKQNGKIYFVLNITIQLKYKNEKILIFCNAKNNIDWLFHT